MERTKILMAFNHLTKRLNQLLTQDYVATIAAYIQPEQFREFEAGFLAIMDAMEIWWQELAQEAISSKVTLGIAIAKKH